MKNLRLCLIPCFALFFQLNIQAQYEIEWGPEIAVSQEGDDNNRPRVVANGDDVLVMWGKNDGNTILFSKWENGAFTPAQSMMDSGIHVFTSDWAGPEIDARNDIFVVFKAIPEDEKGAYLIKSEDWGETWSDTIRIDQPSEGNDRSRFPNVAVNFQDNPAITMMTFEGNFVDPKYVVATSEDGGQTFGPLLNVSTDYFEGEACDCCTAGITALATDVYHAYRNNDENIREIKASHSANWGQTIVDYYSVDSTDTFSNVCFSSGPDIGWDNGLVTVFKATGDFGNRIMISKLNLQNNISSHHPIDLSPPTTVSQNNPRIAIHDAFSTVVWEEYTSTNSNILFSMSMFGIEEIGSQIDTINVEQSGKQINPDIAASYDYVHVVWQDKNSGLVKYRRGTFPPYSVNEVSKHPNSIVFPNPSTALATVQAKDQSLIEFIEIHSIRGELVQRTQVRASTHTLDLSDLSEAVYMLSVHFASGEVEQHALQHLHD